MTQTIIDVLAKADSHAPALLAPGRPTLSFRGLQSQVESTVRQLNKFGIGRNAPVAIVLANGPEMASALYVLLPVQRRHP